MGAENVFLHRKEFRKQFPERTDELPAIFLEESGSMKIIVSASEINICENLDELISIVDERVKANLG